MSFVGMDMDYNVNSSKLHSQFLAEKSPFQVVLKFVKNIFKNYVNPIEIDKKVLYSKSKRTNYVRWSLVFLNSEKAKPLKIGFSKEDENEQNGRNATVSQMPYRYHVPG